jgi:hypothetical protein
MTFNKDKLDNADYSGMIFSKWPKVPEEYRGHYIDLYIGLRNMTGISPRERARAHRWLRYLCAEAKRAEAL